MSYIAFGYSLLKNCRKNQGNLFWYIVGYCFEHKSYRTFNTLFIYNIYVTQKPFVKDSSFDLDAFWETQKKS